MGTPLKAPKAEKPPKPPKEPKPPKPPKEPRVAKPRVAKPKAPTATVRIAALEATVAALGARLEALEARGVTEQGQGEEDLSALVMTVVGELDAAGRYSGLVPIPELRAELRRRGVSDDPGVDAALAALERDWKIDLSVAQSPNQVPDRAAGIERPGRGLLYYVARR